MSSSTGIDMEIDHHQAIPNPHLSSKKKDSSSSSSLVFLFFFLVKKIAWSLFVRLPLSLLSLLPLSSFSLSSSSSFHSLPSSPLKSKSSYSYKYGCSNNMALARLRRLLASSCTRRIVYYLVALLILSLLSLHVFFSYPQWIHEWKYYTPRGTSPYSPSQSPVFLPSMLAPLPLPPLSQPVSSGKVGSNPNNNDHKNANDQNGQDEDEIMIAIPVFLNSSDSQTLQKTGKLPSILSALLSSLLSHADDISLLNKSVSVSVSPKSITKDPSQNNHLHKIPSFPLTLPPPSNLKMTPLSSQNPSFHPDHDDQGNDSNLSLNPIKASIHIFLTCVDFGHPCTPTCPPTSTTLSLPSSLFSLHPLKGCPDDGTPLSKTRYASSKQVKFFTFHKSVFCFFLC
jgi:hypothetical protein